MFVLLPLVFSAYIASATLDSARILLKRQDCNTEGPCNSGVAACLDYICTSCADLSPVIPQCCAGSDDVAKVACIEKGLQGGLGDSGTQSSQFGPETTAPVPSISALPATMTNDPNFVACNSLESMLNGCSSQTPGFSTLTAFSDEAPCLCYSSQVYQGSIYDGYFSSCLHYFSTAVPADYSSIAGPNDGPITSKPCGAEASSISASVTPAATVVRSTGTPAVGGDGLLTHTAASSHPTSPIASNPKQLASSTTSALTGGNAGESNLRVGRTFGLNHCIPLANVCRYTWH